MVHKVASNQEKEKAIDDELSVKGMMDWYGSMVFGEKDGSGKKVKDDEKQTFDGSHED
jgi:hypothetical protein